MKPVFNIKSAAVMASVVLGAAAPLSAAMADNRDPAALPSDTPAKHVNPNDAVEDGSRASRQHMNGLNRGKDNQPGQATGSDRNRSHDMDRDRPGRTMDRDRPGRDTDRDRSGRDTDRDRPEKDDRSAAQPETLHAENDAGLSAQDARTEAQRLRTDDDLRQGRPEHGPNTRIGDPNGSTNAVDDLGPTDRPASWTDVDETKTMDGNDFRNR